jgi:hypothetical protein
MNRQELIALTNSVRDSTLIDLTLSRTDDGFDVGMVFEQMSGIRLALSLRKATRFSAEIDNSIGFYVVSHCKVFSQGDKFYLSLDPYLEGYEPHDRDNFVVICSQIVVV